MVQKELNFDKYPTRTQILHYVHTKNERKYFCIFALASKMGKIKK